MSYMLKNKLDKSHTKLDKGVGAKTGPIDLVTVTHKELLGQIIQVCERQLARVVALTYAKMHDTMVNDVTNTITVEF